MADRRHQDNGQGDVKNPATDGRLKENRGSGGFGASSGRDMQSEGGRKGGRSSNR